MLKLQQRIPGKNQFLSKEQVAENAQVAMLVQKFNKHKFSKVQILSESIIFVKKFLAVQVLWYTSYNVLIAAAIMWAEVNGSSDKDTAATNKK